MDKNADKTRQILSEMLRENTGCHFLDSGGNYGRHWQRNQGRDFESEPVSILSFRHGIEVTHSVCHFLSERLSYFEELDGIFQDFCLEHPDEGYLECIGLFLDHLRAHGLKVAGIYGEGEPVEVNTYNGEDLLSQTIQYTYAEIEGSYTSGRIEDCSEGMDKTCGSMEISGAFVFLQIHGGCDVRGGYTRPRVFESISELGIFDNARAVISCSNPDCRANWSTDDAYHWYHDGCCGAGAGNRLENLDKMTLSDYSEGKETIEELDKIAAWLEIEIHSEEIEESSYRLSCQYGLSGAIRELKGRLERGSLDLKEDAKVRLLLVELTGDHSHLGFDIENQEILYVTESGDGYCPDCGHKLQAYPL